ncbi:oxidoreductase [soil metagenome]
MSTSAGDPLAVLATHEGVPSAMTAARDAVDALLRDRGLRRTGPADTGEALLRGAAASAALEGSACTLDDLRSGRGDATAAAAMRVSSELVGQLPSWQRSPLQTLARLHALATDADDSFRGRPASAASAQRLRGVGELVLAGTAAPGMVLAAVVHAEVATADAFGPRAGLVARAAERLVLIDTGVDPPSLTVPEAGHARSAAAYAAGLARYRDGGRAGVLGWLLAAADAYSYGVECSPLTDEP